MIIFLYGKDTYRSKQQLAKMVEKFRAERDPQGLNLVKLDLERTKENIMQQVLSSPFLAEKRMVVLENLLVSKEKDVQQALLTRIEEQTIPDDIILIIWEATDKPKTKLGKELLARLQKEKFVQHFDELSGAQLVGWILSEIHDRGGEIDRQAANLLADAMGGSMWALSNVIDQLIAYKSSPYQGELEGVHATEHLKGGRNADGSTVDRPHPASSDRGGAISVSDVHLFIEEKADDNIFNLVDAIVNKQLKQVYTMIQEQYRQGEDAGYIFAMLVRQFRILLQLRDLYDRGENLQSGAIAKELGLHPFVVKKSLPMVKRYSLDELKQIHASLLDIDVKTKTGQGDQSMMLDVFVGRVA